MVARLPLIVQSDLTLLLEVDNPLFEEARDALVGFAELVKSPEHIHTYRLSSLSLWNAVAAGLSDTEILSRLSRYAEYAVPSEVESFVVDQAQRYGRLSLRPAPDGDGLWLSSQDGPLLTLISRQKSVIPYLAGSIPPGFRVAPEMRGLLKQALAKIGWPVDDQAGYRAGTPLAVGLRCATIKKPLSVLFGDKVTRSVAMASSSCRAAPARP
jgi:DNA excision repair protein ERCC-3